MNGSRLARMGMHAGWVAGMVFAVALLWLGAVVPGYEHAHMPVSFLGMRGVALAPCWNVAGFIVPGLLVAWFALSLQPPLGRDGTGAQARIGTWLLLISGLAFAGNGVFAYDLAEPDGMASKLHVAMLTIALLGFLPSASLLALALRRRPAWRALVVGGALVALATLASVMQRMGDWLPLLRDNPGYAQRVTLALYFLWLALASRVALRSGAARG
jgi:hypothetical membrane protein